MKKLLFLLFIPVLCLSQNTRWTDYFSYFNIKSVTKVNNLLYCATENGLFSYNENNGEIKKISKVHGLHEIKITAFSYNQNNNVLIIGYDNGKLDVIKGDKVSLVIDIPFEQSYPGNKKINHIYTYGDFAVISLDFGITVFDIKKMEFKETCYFKQGAAYFQVNKSVVLNNTIYAASNKGILSHVIDGMIPDFSAWNIYGSGLNYTQMAINNNSLIAASSNTVFRSDNGGNSWYTAGNYPNLKDIVSVENTVLVVQQNKITVLNDNFAPIESASYTDNLNTGYFSNGNLYAGTQLHGLLKGTEYLAPDGPYNNTSYALSIIGNKLWVAPGGRDANYNAPSATTYGYYYFDGNRWRHIPYTGINNERFIIKVIPNPFNPEEVYVVSYSNGLIKMLNGSFSVLYNHNNSAFKSIERLTGGDFDKNGNLIILQSWAGESSGVNNAIVIKTPDNQFKYLSLLPKRISLGGGATTPYIDDSKGYVWAPAPRGNALVVYKYNNTPLNTSDDDIYLIDATEGRGSLPSNNVICVVLDNSGTAWIGTDNGLRIFRNPYSSLENGSYNTERIIISENGLGEEVLRSTIITSIAVDAANRKWIGTQNTGVFYFSENGEVQLNKFTVDNSPLPSNTIADIKIDETGEVFFVTPRGIVSYRGDITNTGDNFGNIVAYPNPVRPGYTGNITIRGLAHDAYVKITDVAGNLVYETRAPGGVATWNGNNFNNKPVASGVYLVLMSNSEGKKHATTQIAIIR
ncbi:MAG: hypothetical protein LBP34_00420 [Flavobacteriaceae bacterium]|jgi:hypothetical protein|nr:hypothetical protein [Flavobacteriaceae bacterium]